MKKYFWLILILIIGTILRFYHNLDISLWHDEAFSSLLIKYPWSEMMYRIGLDVHPPMYYIFLRIWHYIFGDSLLSLRGFTVFFSVGTIWAAWAFVKEAFTLSTVSAGVQGGEQSRTTSSGRANERAAFWAAILVALNPFQIQYATEARMYTMGAFFALLAAYFLVKALRQQRQLHQDVALNMPNLPQDIHLKRKVFWNYLGFTLSMIVIIYTHYYLFFTAAAIGFYGLLYLFFHHRWNLRKYIPLLASYILILISFLPWLKIFLYQYKQVGAGYWIPPMDRWSVPSTLWTLLIGTWHDVNNPMTQKLLIVFLIFVIYFLYRFLKKTQGFEKWLVILAIIAPFAGSFLFYMLARLKGSGTSVYLVRYFLYTSAFLSIALTLWLKEIKWKWLSVSLFTICILVNLFAFYNYWHELDIKTKPGMAGAAKYLQTNVEPGHKLYVGSSFMFFNLKYYVKQEKIANRPLLFSGGNLDVKNLPHFAGTAILTNDDLLPDFNQEVKTGDTVWLVWTNGFGSNKPQIPKNWAQIEEKAYAEVRPWVGTYVYVTEYKVN